jgi:tol-pal system protein YbgF
MIKRALALSVLSLVFATVPAWSASKEIIQLQTQVELLQQQMQSMQRSFDERMGVMKNLVEQNSDSMNKIAAAIVDVQSMLKKQQTDAGSKADQLSGQIQALNDSIDELKARMAKLTKQLEDMQASQQALAAQAAQVAQQQQAPPPDVLYNNALRDYTAGKNELASQQFLDYLKFYPNTDLAGNAYFYLAELEYRGSNFQQAVKDYDHVIENFPSGNKVAAAHLKKGFSLIELGQQDNGVEELRALLRRFPRTPEATQARERLQKLGVAVTPSRKPH